MMKNKFFFSPYFLILISFMIMILIGGTLLSMPISTTGGEKIKWIDGIFMATSAITYSYTDGSFRCYYDIIILYTCFF